MLDTISFHRVFTSHAVLQRGKPIVFSGNAPAGSKLTVCFDGLERSATATQVGEWRVVFPALPASCSPRTVTLSCPALGQERTLQDLLVGDVWLCSGQSNMEMPVWSPEPHWRTTNAEAEVSQMWTFLPTRASAISAVRVSLTVTLKAEV